MSKNTLDLTKYPFTVNFPVKSVFLYELNKYFKIDSQFDGNGDGREFYASPKSGVNYFDNIECWVCNQEKQGFIKFCFKSLEDWDALRKNIDSNNVTNKNKIQFQIYQYEPKSNTWQLTDKYQFKGENDLIGYSSYIKSIEKDINNFIKYEEFLRSIGETKSINYLLYGPPGTGKTTLIRTFASKYNYPIFIVNPNNLDYRHLKNVLNPSNFFGNQIKILLFEDFDRFLENEHINSVMSQILNSLDGLDDKGNIIRFFSANKSEIILSNEALVNRMSNKFKFGYPDIDMFRDKLKRLLSYYENSIECNKVDDSRMEHYLDLIIFKNITMRPFVNYTLRYMFEDNFMDMLINNINEL